MYATIKFSLLVLILCCKILLQAQDKDIVCYSKFPLKIAFGNHAVGFPYQNSFSAFNPHLSIGTEKALNRNQKYKLVLSSNLGFIKNEHIGNAIIVDLDLGYRIKVFKDFYSEIALSIGFLDQFHPKDIYRYDDSDNSFNRVKDKGRYSSLIGLKTSIGYDFSAKTSLPVAVGLTHNFFIQTSYFDIVSFPIMPQSTTNILITYKFKKQ